MSSALRVYANNKRSYISMKKLCGAGAKVNQSGGAEIVYDGKDITIIKPTSVKDYCQYWKGETTCTEELEETETDFNGYLEYGPLYIIQPKNKYLDNYLIHIGTKTYLSSGEHPIDPSNLVRQYPEMSNMFLDEEIRRKTIPLSLVKYASDDIKNTLPFESVIVYDMQNVSANDFPKTIKEITFRLEGSNRTLKPGVLPENVVSIIIEGINRPLASGMLPEGLKSLFINSASRIPFEEGALPSGLKILRIIGSYGLPLRNNVLPKGLRILRIKSDNLRIEKGVLPEELETLVIDSRFDQYIAKGELPDRLKSLVLEDYTGRFLKDVLPAELKILRVTGRFNQVIEKNLLPQGLEILTLGENFDNSGVVIEKGVMPANLKRVHFSGNVRIKHDAFGPNTQEVFLQGVDVSPYLGLHTEKLNVIRQELPMPIADDIVPEVHPEIPESVKGFIEY